MKPMRCFRAVTVVVMLVGSVLAGLPAVAAQAGPVDGPALDAAANAVSSPERQGASPAKGEGPSATWAINLAIMGLGSVWLLLMARRMLVPGGRMLRSAGPQHVAGGR